MERELPPNGRIEVGFRQMHAPISVCTIFQIELIHDQLPLAVPCYDLLPVTDFTLVLLAKTFGYPRLP